MPKMRTIQEAYNELKKFDSKTAITPYAIRQLVICGAIPHIKAGKKYLINLDVLFEFLSGQLTR